MDDGGRGGGRLRASVVQLPVGRRAINFSFLSVVLLRTLVERSEFDLRMKK